MQLSRKPLGMTHFWGIKEKNTSNIRRFVIRISWRQFCLNLQNNLLHTIMESKKVHKIWQKKHNQTRSFNIPSDEFADAFEKKSI